MAPRNNTRATSSSNHAANDANAQDSMKQMIAAPNASRQVASAIAPSAMPHQETQTLSAAERFTRFHPKRFEGSPHSRKVELWTEGIEDLFSILHFNDAQRVELAVFQLDGSARRWWVTVDARWRREGKPRTWENFVKEFVDKYVKVYMS